MPKEDLPEDDPTDTRNLDKNKAGEAKPDAITTKGETFPYSYLLEGEKEQSKSVLKIIKVNENGEHEIIERSDERFEFFDN